MVPGRPLAALLLFPISENTEKLSVEKQAETKSVADEVFFMKQTVGNACGTVGILHAVLNNPSIPVGGELEVFRAACQGKAPGERALLLEENAGIAERHSTAASTGQTAAPSADEKVNLHFVAFVEVGGRLWELDGRKEKACDWGPVEGGDVLGAAAGAVRRYMKCDPEEMRFTVVALTDMNQ